MPSVPRQSHQMVQQKKADKLKGSLNILHTFWLFCGWFSSASCSLCSQSTVLENTLADHIQNQFICKPGLRNLKEEVCSEKSSVLVYFINYLKFI